MGEEQSENHPGLLEKKTFRLLIFSSCLRSNYAHNNLHPKQEHRTITRVIIGNVREENYTLASKCCLWSRTGFDNEMRRKGKVYQWLTMSSVFESGAAQKYRCSLLQTLREAGPASDPVLRRLCPGKLEEKGSQWVCNCEQAEQGLACMLFIQDMYSLVWGSTASVVGYDFLDCCVCNYKCIICAWEKHLDTYGNNPEGLQVQSDYCVHASHSHHPQL